MTGNVAEADGRDAPLVDEAFTSIVDRWRIRRRLMEMVLNPVGAAWAGLPGVVSPSGMLLHGPDAGRSEPLIDAIAGALDVSATRVEVGSLLDDPGVMTAAEIAGSIIRAAGPGRSVVHLVDLEAANARDGRGSHTSDLLAAGLRELQSGDPVERALLVAISERPWEIAPGLLAAGGLDRTIFLPPPDWELRHRHFAVSWSEAERMPGIERVVAATEGWSVADLDALLAAVQPTGDDRSMERLVATAAATTPTSAGWLDRARRMANYAVDMGRYDDLLGYLRRHRIA